MNLQQYQQAALRTESLKEQLTFNKDLVISLFKLFVLNSELLDALKKEIYYNKPNKMDLNGNMLLLDMQHEINNALYFLNDKVENKNVQVQDINPRVFHGILGFATESGELIDVLLKNLVENKEIDATNVQEEAQGDIGWYTAILSDALNLNWEEGLERNIAKLKERYPEKYTDYNADNRDLDKEREILEGKVK